MMVLKAAERVNDTNDHIFAQLARDAEEVQRQSGRNILNFGAGTPDVQPSQIYIKKLGELYKLPNAHNYPGFKATPDFADALKHWYKKRFSVEILDNELLPLLGAKDGISHIPLAILDPGDELLVPNPGYPSFSDPARLLGGIPIPYDLDHQENFKLNLEAIKSKLTAKTKAIWVNFPSNPTGQVATLDELKNLVDFAKKHDLTVLYDNAYSEISFGDFTAPSILQIDGAKDVAVEIGTFSKSFSFAGFRMGWIVGNASLVQALFKIKSQMDSGMSLPLQGLAAYALTNIDTSWHKQMLISYDKRRSIIASKLRGIGLEFELPQAGLYIWARIPKSSGSSTEFCKYLLKEKQILLTPGSAYGTNGEGYVRASICVNIDHIEEYF